MLWDVVYFILGGVISDFSRNFHIVTRNNLSSISTKKPLVADFKKPGAHTVLKVVGKRF